MLLHTEVFGILFSVFLSFFIYIPLTHLCPLNPHEYWAEVSGVGQGESNSRPHF